MTASAQAALLLTPLVVTLSGRGFQISRAAPGLWDLEVWVEEKRWTPGAVARIRDACRRLSDHFSDPGPPCLRWERQDRIGPPPRGEKRFFRPFLATEGLWVAPPGEKVEVLSGQEFLELELGKARGSGIHPATRCALRLIEHVVALGLPERALDAGTGTGILALAMARWGVNRVMAVDRDPHAVKMTRRNVLRNGLQGRVKVRCRDVSLEGRPYPLVVAHLSHKAIARRAKPILRCVGDGGWLVLGGIWHRWVESTMERFAPPLRVIRREREAWWEAVLLRRE